MHCEFGYTVAKLRRSNPSQVELMSGTVTVSLTGI